MLLQLVDSEIKCLLDDSYKRAMNILVSHKNELNLIAGKSNHYRLTHLPLTIFFCSEALLKYETLDVDDIKAIIEHKKPPTSKLSQASSLLGLKPAGSGLQQLPPVGPVSGLAGIESLGNRKDGPISS